MTTGITSLIRTVSLLLLLITTFPVFAQEGMSNLCQIVEIVEDPYVSRKITAEEIPFLRNGYFDPPANSDNSASIVLTFKLSSSLLEYDYMDNAAILNELQEILSEQHQINTVDFIIIIGAASPEGNTSVNEKLAKERAQAIRTYIMWKFPQMNRERIYALSVGENWQGLRDMVEDDKNAPYRQEIINIIDSRADSDAKMANIRSIGGGSAYRYLQDHILPHLRAGVACKIYYKNEPSRPVVTPEPVEPEPVVKQEPVQPVVAPDTQPKPIAVVIPVEESGGERLSRPLFAIKTNLLFDVVSMLNVEIEVPIGPRWSVAGEYIFPWWLWSKKQYCIETITGHLEGRYWFGEREKRLQLTGWFAGLYTGAGYYDFEWEDKGHQGEYYSVGLSGGYAHKISKTGKWRMEYSLGAGYLHTNYREYVPELGTDNHWHLVRQKSDGSSWIGPTRAKVSLVWMLHCNYNKK